jgi:metal-sulfur cluster biosynthetic enzyme
MSLKEEDIWDALRRIIDPELGCNIVDLGLIYEVKLHGGEVRVVMTLTSQGCPMGDILIAAARLAVCELPGVKSAEVHLVWEPPWNIARIAPSARAALAIPED